MFSSASSTYSLKRPARCIASLVSSDTQTDGTLGEECGGGGHGDTPRFVVGTCSLREANELHVIGFHEESNELLCDQAFSHPDEVWGVSPSPADPSLLLTCSNGTRGGGGDGGSEFKALHTVRSSACPRILARTVISWYVSTPLCRPPSVSPSRVSKVNLWKLPKPDPSREPLQEHAVGGARGAPLEKLGEPQGQFGGLQTAATAILWSPMGGGLSQGEGIVTLADGLLKKWSLGEGRFEETGSSTVCEGSRAAAAARGAPAAAWDPHRPSEVATAAGCSVRCWDLRTMKVTTTVEEAHRFAVRDVDYNPNKPFCIVSCGEDRLIKFWDLRNPQAPVKSIVGHDHWVNTVKYNRFHDQLLLSGSSDCTVHLWRVSSVSSAPLLEPEDDDIDSLDVNGHGDVGGFASGINGSKGEAADIRVRTFDEHEESVYSLAWSACDAWVLASLSYDGQVVLNHVPSTEKYKILL